MSNFLTLEDVNGTLYRNQGFYWHEINTGVFGDNEFSNVKIDFCTVSLEISNVYKYTFVIDNDYWTKGYSVNIHTITHDLFGNVLTIQCNEVIPSLFLYCGVSKYNNVSRMLYHLEEDILNLNLKEINDIESVKVVSWKQGSKYDSDSLDLNVGYNQVTYSNYNQCGFLLVQLIKSDFQFNCNQQLTLGKVNTVKLGTLADYKPNGDMIGANTPTIKVLYKDTYIPVVWNSSQNDYCFDIDLTNKENESNIRFTVLIEANDVINASETDVSLTANYETINNATKLNQLFVNGGIGRLGTDIILTSDLVVENDAYLTTRQDTPSVLDMNGHKLIVKSDKTLKANNIYFSGGNNTIQQNTGSKVELNNCIFQYCTGIGSIIDCQVDIGSLDNPNDFTTLLNNCIVLGHCDCPQILHGGDLTVTNCNIKGMVGNKDYPYFLYQTDGNAFITGTSFRLEDDDPIESDIEFNSCIFICGENAIINNGDHTEWQNNNINGFLNSSKNTSTIDITYYYDAIEDYITLSSNNGYCHSVSGADYVFKTNVTLQRGD